MTRKVKRKPESTNGFKSLAVNRRIVLVFILILVINFNHNWRVSGENTGRNFQYDSWQQLTKESKLFKDVRDSDIFISSNQNDAFETNAGSFYVNTGIRLAYLFNTSSIFPNFSECILNSICNLTGVREKSIATLPNLTRGTFVPRLADKKRIDDWVGINSKQGALRDSTIWAFDVFLLTPTTYFSYLAPFLDNEVKASVNFYELRVVTVTSKNKNEFGPAIANVCLVQDGEILYQSGLMLTQWKVPMNGVDPSGAPIIPSNSLDFREVQAGTCALK